MVNTRVGNGIDVHARYQAKSGAGGALSPISEGIAAFATGLPIKDR